MRSTLMPMMQTGSKCSSVEHLHSRLVSALLRDSHSAHCKLGSLFGFKFIESNNSNNNSIFDSLTNGKPMRRLSLSSSAPLLLGAPRCDPCATQVRPRCNPGATQV